MAPNRKQDRRNRLLGTALPASFRALPMVALPAFFSEVERFAAPGDVRSAQCKWNLRVRLSADPHDNRPDGVVRRGDHGIPVQGDGHKTYCTVAAVDARCW